MGKCWKGAAHKQDVSLCSLTDVVMTSWLQPAYDMTQYCWGLWSVLPHTDTQSLVHKEGTLTFLSTSAKPLMCLSCSFKSCERWKEKMNSVHVSGDMSELCWAILCTSAPVYQERRTLISLMTYIVPILQPSPSSSVKPRVGLRKQLS